mmetsp:Transcript_36181/g.108345  ORF Transcript_36181/g.108345 Transcript_36181/m.108345 type:complete len:262 (-) Transcript_36181:629-1414(-)
MPRRLATTMTPRGSASGRSERLTRRTTWRRRCDPAMIGKRSDDATVRSAPRRSALVLFLLAVVVVVVLARPISRPLLLPPPTFRLIFFRRRRRRDERQRARHGLFVPERFLLDAGARRGVRAPSRAACAGRIVRRHCCFSLPSGGGRRRRRRAPVSLPPLDQISIEETERHGRGLPIVPVVIDDAVVPFADGGAPLDARGEEGGRLRRHFVVVVVVVVMARAAAAAFDVEHGDEALLLGRRIIRAFLVVVITAPAAAAAAS